MKHKKTKFINKNSQRRKNSLRRKNNQHRKTFKRMNCSPAVKGKTPVNGSCFTDTVLRQLKTAYNKHHSTDKIVDDNPTIIWNELKMRLSTCDKEDCWLNEISDQSVRDKLDKQIFAPDQPDDWKQNNSAWLSNFDICDVLKQYEEPFPNFKVIGPTPIDFDTRPPDMNGQCVWQDLCTFSIEKMISSNKTKLGIVFNIDVHTGKGIHWVSMFVDLDDNYIFYLDSAGDKILPEIDALVKRIIDQGVKIGKTIRFHENCPTEHQAGENECGMYALYFIITMLTGKTEKAELNTFMDKIEFFKNKRIPDSYVNKFRKIYFNY